MYQLLETDRLIIKPISIADAAFFYQLANSKGWLEFIGDRNIKNEKDAEKYIQRIIDNKGFFYHIFEIKETRQPVGVITFLHRDDQEFPDIGFALLPAFEKKGFAFEASRKYLDEIIKQKISKKILGITLSENESSIHLLERLGLKFESSFMRDNRMVSLYALEIQFD